MKKHLFSLVLLAFYSFDIYGQTPIPIIKEINTETQFIDKAGKIVFTLPIGHQVVTGAPPYLHFNPAHNQGMQAIKVFKDGKAVVINLQKNVYWIDEKGKKIKDFGQEYFSMTALIEGYHLAWKKESSARLRTVNVFLDKNGNPVFEDKMFESAAPFSEGFAAVQLKQTREWCYINTTGNKAFEIDGIPANRIVNLSSFNNGMARIVIRQPGSGYGNTLAYINTKGEKIIDVWEKYKGHKLSSSVDFRNGLLALLFHSKEGNQGRKNLVVLNKIGEEVFTFDDIEQVYNLPDGRFIIMQTTPAENSTFFLKYYISDKVGNIKELSLGEETFIKDITYTGDFVRFGIKKKDDIKTYQGIYQLNPLKELFLTDRYIIGFDQKLDRVLLGDKRNFYSVPHKYSLQKIDGTLIWETPVKDQLFTSIEEALKNKKEVTRYYQTDIADFEKGLFKLKNLEELKMKRLRIRELPKDLSKFKKLKKLEVVGNVQLIPKELCELKQLEHLSLNEFDVKPEGLEYFIEHTPSLRYVMLEGIILSNEFFDKMEKINPMLLIEEEFESEFIDQEIDEEEEIVPAGKN